MKHLLYLDRDFLYSYYAQAFDGIEDSRQTEHLDQTQSSQETESASTERNIDFELKFPAIANIKAGRNDADEHLRSSFYETEAVREAVTVSMHDNALNKVIKHSDPKVDSEFSVGNYVIVKGPFFLTDSKYILDRITPEMIAYIAEGTWEERLKNLQNPNADAVQKMKKTFIDNEKTILQKARKSIEASSKMAQFDLFMLVNNCIIPLKREYMREDSRLVIFKYDSEVTVFGRATRINNASATPDPKNSLAVLNKIFNEVWPKMLINFGLLKDMNYTVISPMAVYFE